MFALIEFQKNISNYYQCRKLIKVIENNENVEALVKYRQKFLKLTYFVYDKKFTKEYFPNQNLPVVQETNTRSEFPFFETVLPAKRMLLEAEGHYEDNIKSSLNPFRWIKGVLFLPSKILQYLGVDEKSKLSKSFNVIWWFISLLIWFFTPILESTRALMLEIITNYLNNQ